MASEPEWRDEVARRLAAYRARRRRLRHDPSQSALPFTGDNGSADPEAGEEHASFLPIGVSEAESPEPSPEAPARVEHVEIDVSQPALNDAPAEEHPRPRFAGASSSEAPLLPVAALGQRLRAGLIDAFFLLLGYGGFLALFGSLGGHFSFGKFDAVVYVANLYLVYAQYFALFTVFGGATPGMLLRRLSVVSFDGAVPTPRQLLWRSFGYLVSGGTVMLGFLWALWDEDRLTWQDRISQTYLTYAERLEHREPLDALHGSHGVAPR